MPLHKYLDTKRRFGTGPPPPPAPTQCDARCSWSRVLELTQAGRLCWVLQQSSTSSSNPGSSDSSGSRNSEKAYGPLASRDKRNYPVFSCGGRGSLEFNSFPNHLLLCRRFLFFSVRFGSVITGLQVAPMETVSVVYRLVPKVPGHVLLPTVAVVPVKEKVCADKREPQTCTINRNRQIFPSEGGICFC